MTGRRIVDLGCLGGGYTAEFARLGFDALGIEIRQTNFENCLAVKNAVDLPNLHFVRDNVWNVANYGEFDAVFCCGILYHLDRPREFLRLVSGQCRRIILVQTHFSTLAPIEDSPALLKFNLSPMSENEGLPGRWYPEHNLDHLAESEALEKMSWTSWENNRSFWIQREYLIEAIHENGFDMVFEQYRLPGLADLPHDDAGFLQDPQPVHVRRYPHGGMIVLRWSCSSKHVPATRGRRAVPENGRSSRA